MQNAFIGIDIGTQGVRASVLLADGRLCASRSHSFLTEQLRMNRREQNPELWWQSVVICLQQIATDLRKKGESIWIHALTVSSTSGTVIPLDKHYHPLNPAIMYSDPRSAKSAEVCRSVALDSAAGRYRAFSSSSGLSKMVWFNHTYPELAEKVRLWVHAADYIVGRLSGVWGVTDETNSLKTGYDLETGAWPDYISNRLHIPVITLPRVVRTGTVIGQIAPKIAEQVGLPESVLVTSGVTDSCASQIASGAIRPGSWNTTIGTTMVLKGVTLHPLQDEKERIYNHKHPDGYWMPGGASNTGADWVSLDYDDNELGRLNMQAEQLSPSPWLAYPLMQSGERFPFIAPEASGFEPTGLSPVERYTARMEGTAYMEKLSYQMITELSGDKVPVIYSAGGASNSKTWLQIRSNVMGVPLVKMKYASGSTGAAMLAASRTYYSNLSETGDQMLVSDIQVEPGPHSVQETYRTQYGAFVDRLAQLGYLAGWKGVKSS